VESYNQNTVGKEDPSAQEGARYQALLVEYQAAQDSAQHHDSLTWSGTGVIWGSSLILLGFILSSLTQPGLLPLIVILSLLGLALNVYAWIAALRANSVKRQKYARCKEIEQIFDLHQHRDLPFTPRIETFLYGLVMLFFFAAWIMVFSIAVGLLPTSP
jgi:hypothetical protein